MLDKNLKYCAIIDYGMGNLFSVANVCEHVGLNYIITNQSKDIQNASVLILPGVGAFDKAMLSLKRYDLIDSIMQFVSSGKMLVGICLGMQLLFEKSYEFGEHDGLGIIKGDVSKFKFSEAINVPHIGWNKIMNADMNWTGTLLEGLENNLSMYFIHSYYCNPLNESSVLSESEYGGKVFCSSVKQGNIFGFQFHPEKSAKNGIALYHNIKNLIGGFDV